MLAPTLRDDLGISNTGYASILTAFLLAYTFMQPVTGWLIDRIGTRLGFALIMGWWSAAAILHAFGTSVATFAACRFLLGMGEAGSWAACVKAVSEWFPRTRARPRHRLVELRCSDGPRHFRADRRLGQPDARLAMGIHPHRPQPASHGSRLWLWIYRVPRHAQEAVTEPTIAHSDASPYLSLLRSRNVWAVIAARLLADPWVWFYYFWIPEYLTRSAGFTAADIGKYAWIPFLAQGVGIVLGGVLSDVLLRRGMRAVQRALRSCSSACC